MEVSTYVFEKVESYYSLHISAYLIMLTLLLRKASRAAPLSMPF